jgi:hypothetical protein
MNAFVRTIVPLLLVAATTGHAQTPQGDITFELTSRQFVFESGTISFFRLSGGPEGVVYTLAGQRVPTGPESLREFAFRDGTTEPVKVAGPGEFEAMMGSFTAVRRSDQRRFKLAAFAASGDITEDALKRAHLSIAVDIPVVLTFRVEDAAGHAMPNARIGISTEHWSPELTCDEKGEVTVFGTAGHYRVLATSPDGRQRHGQPLTFEIAAADRGERLITFKIE